MRVDVSPKSFGLLQVLRVVGEIEEAIRLL